MKLIKIFVVLSVICLGTFLIGCTSQFKYIEGNIYSETILKDYNNSNLDNELDDILTRDKAIEYSESVFNEVFNIKIDRDKLRESINLTKGSGDDFYWNIVWEKIENNSSDTQYYFFINSNTKEIRNCGVIRFNNEEEYDLYYEGEREVEYDELNKILKIAEPMIKKIGIDIYDYSVEAVDRGNRKILMVKSEQKYYEFLVDMEIGQLLSFNSYGGIKKGEDFNS